MITIDAKPNVPRMLDNLNCRPPFFQEGNDRDLTFTIHGLCGCGTVKVELRNLSAYGPLGDYYESQSVPFDEGTTGSSVQVTFSDKSHRTDKTEGNAAQAGNAGKNAD
jgi:hypothetical protein